MEKEKKTGAIGSNCGMYGDDVAAQESPGSTDSVARFQMATCQVRFEFYCDKRLDGIQFIHDMPAELVTSQPAAQQDAEYGHRSGAALLPIMKEHKAACLASSSPICGVCGSSAATVLQTPMSWLHKDGDPFVGVIVNAVCLRRECELQMRRDVTEIVYCPVYYHTAHGSCAGTCTIIAQPQDNNLTNVMFIYDIISFLERYDVRNNGWQYIVSHYWTH